MKNEFKLISSYLWVLIVAVLLPLLASTQQTVLIAFKGFGNKYGLRTETGKIIVQPKYDLAYNSTEGISIKPEKKLFL